MFKNEYTLSVDIKKTMSSIVPTFVQYDNAALVFKIYDDGKPFNLTGFTKAEVSHIRSDGVFIVGDGEIETLSNGEKVIRYTYAGNEMGRPGFVATSLSVYSSDKKVSIQPFKVSIVGNAYDDFLEATPEVGLLQSLISSVSGVVDQANRASTSASQAVTQANTAVTNANQAITNAAQATNAANAAATNANEKAGIANTAATNANTKATLADEKATLANQAVTNANAAIANVNQAITGANTAKDNANAAATSANQAVTNLSTTITRAETATTNANNAAASVEQAKTDANTATQNANQATTNANTATSNVNTELGLLTTLKATVETAKDNAITATSNANAAATAANTAANNTQAIVNNVVSVGAFSLATSYQKNNIVTNNGSSWIALVNTQNNPLPTLPTTQNTWWRLLAEKGKDGTNGTGSGTVTKVNNVEPDGLGAITLTPSSIGAAPSTHNHTTTNITGLDSALAAKYTKPANGIPSTDLASSIQNSLSKAETALQSVADASTTAKGIVQLNNTLTSTSTSLAATAAQAKALNDKIVSHSNSIATTSAPGHVIPDGTTIVVDSNGRISTASGSGTSIIVSNTAPQSLPTGGIWYQVL